MAAPVETFGSTVKSVSELKHASRLLWQADVNHQALYPHQQQHRKQIPQKEQALQVV